ncbi:tetratricopeptide repeat protein [Paenibacillus wenxiniae]|uniref:Tetratricopeptide repeat protein n=1 Tax=Paenibacillus wenxiniae TaxID=1636843 RepID=A0ABW4RKY6_9BACL
MNDYKRKTEEAERKVIRLQMDANFFFERAVRSLDRYRYDKALTYFQKAVEYEPENPVNHCNLAGILSEMGQYDASNEVLQHIMGHVDPMMSECHFYMANNYANIEQFAEAERELLIYMEKDANGAFIAEANEMLDVVQHERARTGAPRLGLPDTNEEAPLEPREQGRLLLEEGDVEAACDLLQQALVNEPDDDAARNNLVVALYHLGKLEQAAFEVEELLRREPHNLHGLCNQALILQQMGQHSLLLQQISILRRIHPMHQEHLLKLAITLAMLGQHEAAYIHFARLIRQHGENAQQEIYHYAAVAACYVGKYDQSVQWWRRILRLDSEAEVPAFYIAHLEKIRNGQLQPSYRYALPYVDAADARSYSAERVSEPSMANDSEAQLLLVLRQGTEQQQLQALQTYTLEGSAELHRALREYAAAPQTSAPLKLAAERLLRQWIFVHRLADDRLIDDLESARSSLPIWEERWQHVLDMFRLHSPMYQQASFRHDVEALWLEFIKRSYPELPRLQQPEGWAAALEYLIARLFRQPLTYAEVAERYDSTISSVSRYARRISRLCHMQSKVQRSLTKSNQGS